MWRLPVIESPNLIEIGSVAKSQDGLFLSRKRIVLFMTPGLSFLHLAVFEAVLRLKSVTLAADALGMPQPSLSRYLGQLRTHFDNPLFVRTRAGMEPTSVAASAAKAISDALQIYRSRLSGGLAFDPANSHRQFRIAASDLGHLLILPELELLARRIAPSVRFSAIPLSRVVLVTQLETGEVDLAIGSFPQLMAGIREQTLFSETYVCVVARTPGGPASLTEARFRSTGHILVAGHPLGHVHEETERRIRAFVGVDNIRVESQSFLLAAEMAQRQELILTVPSRVTQMLNASRVKIFPPPITLPGFDVKQYWHERFDDDPGNRWLRTTILQQQRFPDSLNAEHQETG